MLTVPMFALTGKCQAYHSRTCIAQVVMFLSELSSSAVPLQIGLSWRLGTNYILPRLKLWPRPRRALPTSTSLRFFRSLAKCMRQPRSSSLTLWPWLRESLSPRALPRTAS
jgi:hypothetical protein